MDKLVGTGATDTQRGVGACDSTLVSCREFEQMESEHMQDILTGDDHHLSFHPPV